MTKRRLKAASAISAAAVVAAIAPGLATSPANAGGLSLHLPSTLSVSATPSEDGSQVTFVATVKVLNLPGLIITPSGSVTFTNNNATQIGSPAKIASCLLTTCTATMTAPTSALNFANSNLDTITASWPGDLIAAPASNTVDVSASDCGQYGCVAQVENTTTDLYITSDSDTGSITASLGGAALPCSVSGGGSVGNIGMSGLDSDVSIDLDYYGAAGTAYANVVEQAKHDYMCWVKPTSFPAWTNNGSPTFTGTPSDFNRLGPAALITSGPYAGQYAGLLPDCGELGDVEFDYACISDQGPSEGGNFFTHIETPPGDPRTGGG